MDKTLYELVRLSFQIDLYAQHIVSRDEKQTNKMQSDCVRPTTHISPTHCQRIRVCCIFDPTLNPTYILSIKLKCTVLIYGSIVFASVTIKSVWYQTSFKIPYIVMLALLMQSFDKHLF